eukprot:4970335-Pleurochrysis_carterae.AAC.1
MAVRADGSVCYPRTTKRCTDEASSVLSGVHIVGHIIQRLILLRIGARHAFLSDPYFCRRAPENVDLSRAESTFVAKLRIMEAVTNGSKAENRIRYFV